GASARPPAVALRPGAGGLLGVKRKSPPLPRLAGCPTGVPAPGRLVSVVHSPLDPALWPLPPAEVQRRTRRHRQGLPPARAPAGMALSASAQRLLGPAHQPPSLPA